MYQVPGTPSYERRLLPKSPSLAELGGVIPDYAAMLFSVMTAIADRYDRRPGYPYLDTKINLMTGEDFSSDDALRGHGTIYGWIQGRGLEALVDHCRWLRRHPEIAGGQMLLGRLERIMREVADNLSAVRNRNDGHIYFLMTPEGEPFTLQVGERKPLLARDLTRYSFTDTFCAKGLYAASIYLQDSVMAAEALQYCYAVDAAIWEGRFNQNEREGNGVRGDDEAQSYKLGPYMIELGIAAVLAETAAEGRAVELGLKLIRHIIADHINIERRVPEFREYDVWEAVGEDRSPFRENGQVRSNPGHSIEFVGLGLKFTAAAKHHPACTPAQRAEIERVEALMPPVLVRCFDNGFSPASEGIILFIDLVTREPMSEIMPWWNLPETLRAAMLSWRVAGSEEERKQCLRVLSACHNAFAEHYVRPELHLMAYQTRSAKGEPVAIIPATPDADPGYHTGCSVLDFLNAYDELPTP